MIRLSPSKDYEMCFDWECPSAKTCVRSPDSGTQERKDQQWFEQGSARGAAPDCVFYEMAPSTPVTRSTVRRRAVRS